MSPEDHQPPLDSTTPRPHHVIARLQLLEYRAWSIAVLAAGAGIVLMSLTFSDVGRLAMYNAGIGCCVAALIIIATAIVLAHMRLLFITFAASREHFEATLARIEAVENEVLGVAEDELRRRRGRG